MRLKLLPFLLAMMMVTSQPLRAADTAQQNRQHFISVINDLPLMAELEEIGDGVQFSTPQGRIAEVSTRGQVSKATVLAFYDKTLPQLGWTRISSGNFAREGETLALTFEQKNNELSVQFSVVPATSKK